MRSAIPLAALLCAALLACSGSDDLGRAVVEGHIQGRHLDDHDHDHHHDHHHDEDCDEDHEGEDCDEHDAHEGDEHAGADHDGGALEGGQALGEVAASTPASQVEVRDAAGSPAPPEEVAAAPPPATPSSPAPPPSDPALSGPAPASQAPAAPARRAGRFDPAAYTWIDFDPLIEFDYPELVRIDGDTPPPELPAEVRALHGKKVALEGFMNPLAFDAGGVKEFSLVKDPSFCCFGMIPQMNHWIHVVMPDKQRTEFYSFDPVAVYGVLEVGEEYEDGYVVSLYRMVADKVEGDF